MEKEFIPYEQALALKELGFDEPCLIDYNIEQGKMYIEHHEDGITNTELHKITDQLNEEKLERGLEKEEFLYEYSYAAATWNQAFRWFREKYDLHCNIDPWGYCIFDDNGTEKTGFETYEQSQLECIEELIKIVK
jgi:hypothetical protein